MENWELLAFAEDVARGAGDILRRNYGRQQKIHFKGEIDLVTEVDRESERYILGRIREAFPDHGVLSEESPEQASPSPYRWIVDPLDGTTNYAHGYPCFCVSVGVERDGEMAAGVVYDPLLDELYAATAGAGAFRNGERIGVSAISDLRKGLLATGFAYDVKVSADNNFDTSRRSFSPGRRSGGTAPRARFVLRGLRAVRRILGAEAQTWDTAAGFLILKKRAAS